jgi:hypothetical protein
MYISIVQIITGEPILKNVSFTEFKINPDAFFLNSVNDTFFKIGSPVIICTIEMYIHIAQYL